MKVKIKSPEVSQSVLAQAYKLVQQDLLAKFQQMKVGASIRVTKIGVFEKRAGIARSGFDKKSYPYQSIIFRMGAVLKRALD